MYAFVRVTLLAGLLAAHCVACPWMLEGFFVNLPIDPDGSGNPGFLQHSASIPLTLNRTSPLFGIYLNSWECSGPCEFDIELWEDLAGAPGNLIESIHLAAHLGGRRLRSTTRPLLISGSPYLLVVTDPGWVGDPEFPPETYSATSLSMILIGAPEPGTGLLAVVGIAVLAAFAKVKHTCVRGR